MSESISLHSGQVMPLMGLGTWQAKPEVVQDAVQCALETGYRLIDTAYNYGNEEAIGKAIRKWIENGGKREELFVTTKLPNFGNRSSDVSKYLGESMSKLGLDYLDLYLVHHPFGFKEPPAGISPPILDLETDHRDIWKEMETAVKSGKVKNIGLSNFNAQQVEAVASSASIPPANLQVELHLFLQQPHLLRTCQSLGISITAYAPLGSPAAKSHFKDKYNFQPKEVPNALNEAKVVQLAEKHGKTPAQILLRFLTQLGICVVPKSASRNRIVENFEALHFKLDQEDVETLKTFDMGEKGRLFDFLFYEGVNNHPEYPFPLAEE